MNEKVDFFTSLVCHPAEESLKNSSYQQFKNYIWEVLVTSKLYVFLTDFLILSGKSGSIQK